MHPFHHRARLSRFVLTLGVADMVIGGVGDRFSLFLLGLTTAGVGLLLRWSRRSRSRSLEARETQPFETGQLKILPPRKKAVRRSTPLSADSSPTQEVSPPVSKRSAYHYRQRRIY